MHMDMEDTAIVRVKDVLVDGNVVFSPLGCGFDVSIYVSG